MHLCYEKKRINGQAKQLRSKYFEDIEIAKKTKT